MAMAAVTSATAYQRRSRLPLETLPDAGPIPFIEGLGSPRQMKQRDTLPRHVGGETDLTILHFQPSRRGEKLELAGGLQVSILLRGRVLRRAHLLPHGVGVAV